MATAGSPAGVGLVMKSPIRAGRSYTQLGNTGFGCVGFFLLCFSLSIFRVTSAGYRNIHNTTNIKMTQIQTLCEYVTVLFDQNMDLIIIIIKHFF